jgi:hypothetical protein
LQDGLQRRDLLAAKKIAKETLVRSLAALPDASIKLHRACARAQLFVAVLTPTGRAPPAAGTGHRGGSLVRDQVHDPLLFAKVGGIEQHLTCPAIDVAYANQVALRPHSLSLFGPWHGERLFDGTTHPWAS